MSGDPRRTADLAAVHLMNPFVGGGKDVLPTSIMQDDPDSRANCWYIINASWCLLGFACLLMFFFIGVPLRIAFGKGVGDVVVGVAMGAIFFCLAGCANALWRRYWFLAKAQRHLRTGAQRSAYEAAWKRTLPRNRSVLFQLAVGLLAVYVTASSL